eukprot:5658567-Prymnesium_polylepis.1
MIHNLWDTRAARLNGNRTQNSVKAAVHQTLMPPAASAFSVASTVFSFSNAVDASSSRNRSMSRKLLTRTSRRGRSIVHPSSTNSSRAS